MGPADLAQTVEAAQRGDLVALGQLVDEFARTALGAAYGWCGDWEQARDIAQESFAIVIEKLGELREPAAFPGWLLTLVRTAAGRAARRGRPFEVLPADAESPDDRPDDALAAREEAQRMRLAVESLPATLRLPTVLHYFAGLGVAEIGAFSALPVSTVKKRMRDARLRLRMGVEDMSEEMLSPFQSTETESLSDAIRLYTALRAGDVKRVRGLLEARPELVDVRESWTRDESFVHRLPFLAHAGGTPLLRAIDRDDLVMARLLLDHGADPNGSCACPGGERPLWTAVVHRRVDIAVEVLARGADPNAQAFRKTTPLHVAIMRGYEELVDLLRAHGGDPDAEDASGRSALAWAAPAHPDLADRLQPLAALAWETGIKAIDLWCPLPRRGLVRWTAGAWLGSTVLLAELSRRAHETGRSVVWTGFAPSPIDLGDVAHGLAELGVAEFVNVSIGSHLGALDEQLGAFEYGIELATKVSTSGDAGALLVVFEEVARASEIERRLPRLATLPCTTIVVAPLGEDSIPPAPSGSVYMASVAFDRERARRMRWPAVGPEGSWSRLLDAEGAALAARARAILRAGGDAADRLDAYFAQPFFTAEPFSGRPGEFVPIFELRAAMRALSAR